MIVKGLVLYICTKSETVPMQAFKLPIIVTGCDKVTYIFKTHKKESIVLLYNYVCNYVCIYIYVLVHSLFSQTKWKYMHMVRFTLLTASFWSCETHNIMYDLWYGELRDLVLRDCNYGPICLFQCAVTCTVVQGVMGLLLWVIAGPSNSVW